MQLLGSWRPRILGQHADSLKNSAADGVRQPAQVVGSPRQELDTQRQARLAGGELALQLLPANTVAARVAQRFIHFDEIERVFYHADKLLARGVRLNAGVWRQGVVEQRIDPAQELAQALDDHTKFGGSDRNHSP
jgi:hypothetical protein